MSEARTRDCVGFDHASLPGHFPGQPVVPGVVLLERVAAAAGGGPVRALPAVKFVARLAPGEGFEIVWTRTGDAVRFRCERAGTLLAQGTMVLGSAG